MFAANASPEVAALQVADVVKSFPRRRPIGELLKRPFSGAPRHEAVRGVSFDVAQGELVGLLGPNGAGKTTLLKMLCGLIVPDRGRIRALGQRVDGPRLSELIGLVHGDERSFYWRLTARENLEFFARLYGLPADERRARVQRLLERVDLAGDASRRFGDFSSGMRQRMAIARSLLADPPVLLMDEPTRSLDPVTATNLREWIRDELHGKDGKAILIATHNLREAEILCERVIVVAKGLVRADDTPAALRRRGLGGVTYRLRLRASEALGGLEGGEILEDVEDPEGGRSVLVRMEHEDELDGLLGEVRGRGLAVLGCAPEEAELETVFQTLVRDAGEAS
jgi:ABC-2 type transport system ATP-binding protein